MTTRCTRWMVFVLVAGTAGSTAASLEEGSAMARSDVARVRVEVAPGAGPVEHRAAELFSRCVMDRTGKALARSSSASTRCTITIGRADAQLPRFVVDRDLRADGYRILAQPTHRGRVYVAGQSPSGVVAGVGALLRAMAFEPGAIRIPEMDLCDAPELPVRGIYFATHFGNFYHVAPLEEVDRVIEEFALWGGNELVVWFDMHHFRDFADPAARAHVARLRHFADTAHAVGMRFGLTFIANEGYDSSPEALRADGNTGTAHYHRELCPSKPEGLALIGRWQAEVLDAFRDVDLAWTWPYDQGGCACPDCAPWGANGFLKASEQLARLYRARFPQGRLWLSTWLLDQVNAKGEYDGLLSYIERERPQWIDGIIVGTHSDWIPEPLLHRPEPDRYPLAAFPEISMYRMEPWGEHGANPLPGFCSRLADKLSGQVIGGWPYSEGIYEDLNRFYWARFFWRPSAATDDILREYAVHYLGADVADDAVRLFRLMEQTHARSGWRVADLTGADEERRLAESINSRLPAWARVSWRWRILYIRAAIDGLLASEPSIGPEAHTRLQALCDELVRIYHADGTFIRPPALPRLPDPRNLALGRPVTASSCQPGYGDRGAHLTDGIRAEDDGENFWCHDPRQEETATLTVDIGRRMEVAEVNLQLRGLYGAFWFVPESIDVSISDDGVVFRPVAGTREPPREGAPYSPEPVRIAIGQRARYVRVRLGRSQHQKEPYAGVLELTELEVLGP
ncbi:MAG TPA: discoidin domain-containing protein [Armatimonadota bacterium]|nr:discoidin domain-containing protein [Armatimonadota bacterium]